MGSRSRNKFLNRYINNDNAEELRKYLMHSEVSQRISQQELNEYLISAVKKKSFKCLEVCLRSGANINFYDTHRMTAVLYAADLHNLEALIILKKFDADFNCSDSDGTTTLMYSCKWDASDCLQFLINLSDSDNINQKSKDGSTAIKFAAQHDSMECVLRLIGVKADLNCTDYEGYSPLMHALKRNHENIAQVLIDQGADVNIVGKDGKTALSYAFHSENSSLIESILIRCKSFNALQNQNGGLHSYLHKMIAIGNKRVIRLMLIRDCLPTDEICRDIWFKFSFYRNEALSPLSVALLTQNDDIAKYLVVNKFFSVNDRSKSLEKWLEIQTFLEQQPHAADTLSVIDYILRHADVLFSSDVSQSSNSQWPNSKVCFSHWRMIPLGCQFLTEPCCCTDCIDGFKTLVNP